MRYRAWRTRRHTGLQGITGATGVQGATGPGTLAFGTCFGGMCAVNVQVNGTSLNTARVAPGARFTVAFDYGANRVRRGLSGLYNSRTVARTSPAGRSSSPRGRLMFALSRTALAFTVMALSAQAQSADSVRKEIEASYARALEAMRQAKSMADLDEIDRTLDTQDWQSISPGQQPTNWQNLRKYPFEESWAPFQSARILIDTFELTGDTVVFTGRLRTVNMKGSVGFIPVRGDVEANGNRLEAADPPRVQAGRNAEITCIRRVLRIRGFRSARSLPGCRLIFSRRRFSGSGGRLSFALADRYFADARVARHDQFAGSEDGFFEVR